MAAAATLSSSACPSITANDLISMTWNLPLIWNATTSGSR